MFHLIIFFKDKPRIRHVETVYNKIVPVSDLKSLNQAKQYYFDDTARRRAASLRRFSSQISRTHIEQISALPVRHIFQ